MRKKEAAVSRGTGGWQLSFRARAVPLASNFSEPDDNPPKVRPVIDIVQDGRVFHGGKLWYDPKKHAGDHGPMAKLLLDLKKRPETTTKRERIGERVMELVHDPILVRADRHTEWHYIGVSEDRWTSTGGPPLVRECRR